MTRDELFTVGWLRGEGFSGDARTVARVFMESYPPFRGGGEEGYRRFFTFWQKLVQRDKSDGPLFTNVTETDLKICAELEHHKELCEHSDFAYIRISCPRCGHLFFSRRRGGHYARNCGACHPNTVGLGLLRNPSPQGGVMWGGDLTYPNRRNTTQEVFAWQVVLCDHPKCLNVFTTTAAKTKRCAKHSHTVTHPQEVKRERERHSQPKCERFRFAIDPSFGKPLMIRDDDGCPVTLRVGAQYTPRNERELLQLAESLHRGHVTVRDA